MQRKAYEQLAKLPDFEGWQLNEWGTMIYDFGRSRPNAMTILRDIDVDVLPILAEALDDETPTKTVTELDTNIAHRRGWKPPVYVWKVNELVARLIRDIADRHFILGEWGDGAHLSELKSHRNRIPEFQKQILEWYKQNKDRTPEQRKIADLHSDLRNRLDAVAWLAKKKSVEAVPTLMNRIDVNFVEMRSSSTEAELAAISLALGQIGDPKGYPAVKKACDHLSETLLRAPWSGAIQDLFTAYHGMALLGHKKEALAELKRIYEKNEAKMAPRRRAEYQTQLTAAATW